MKIWKFLGSLFLALSTISAIAISKSPAEAQTAAAIDPITWMVGEWTGTSQAGVSFSFTIDPKGNVNYVFGGRTLATGPAEKDGDSVKFAFTSAAGHYIRLTPAGPNSGSWMYVGGNTVSRSTITRKRP